MPLIVSGADDRQVKLWRMNGNVCYLDTRFTAPENNHLPIGKNGVRV